MSDRLRRWVSVPDAEALLDRLEREAEHTPDPASIEPVTADPDDD